MARCARHVPWTKIDDRVTAATKHVITVTIRTLANAHLCNAPLFESDVQAHVGILVRHNFPKSHQYERVGICSMSTRDILFSLMCHDVTVSALNLRSNREMSGMRKGCGPNGTWRGIAWEGRGGTAQDLDGGAHGAPIRLLII